MSIPKKCALLVVLSFATALLVIGCERCEQRFCPPPSPLHSSRSHRAERPTVAPPHGGTSNVNGAAYDSMFFRDYGTNPYVDADDDAVSTFAMDVDTGSYALVRSYLQRGSLPPTQAVRVEEFVNAFQYDYGPPERREDAFGLDLAAAASPFAADRVLMRVAVQAREVWPEDRKPADLTFVIDVSGSMARDGRLELVKQALRTLVERLDGDDRVAIVAYNERAWEVLDHHALRYQREILRTMDRLSPGGSTNAADGLALGYRLAEKARRSGAISRVILCSDGVANVGETSSEGILKIVEDYKRKGIELTAIGVGMGNYNDVLLEQLADRGDGRYFYVDSIDEARRLFVEQLSGTLQTVARDAKVQVRFNPDVVRSYRLMGYENRDLADKDFRDNRADGGEIGAGHSVTALYELKLWPRRGGRLAEATIRWRDPDRAIFRHRELSARIDSGAVCSRFDDAPASLRLAACAARFAEVLRDSYWAHGAGLDDVLALAKDARHDCHGRQDAVELVQLIETARRLGAGKGEVVSAAVEE